MAHPDSVEEEWRQSVRFLARTYAELGLIPRYSICQRCNRKPSVHLHHPNYGEFATVVWLCASCHAKEHPAEFARQRDERGRMVAASKGTRARVPQASPPVK